MNHELTSFLTRHRACTEGLSRLAVTGSATPEEAWERADASDLIWAVTRPVVMSKMQRRKFLSEAVLAPIEHLLTDERSKNILQKLRTNERVTQEDKDASRAAYAADAADAADAAWAAADAAACSAADDAWASAYESARAAACAACASWASFCAARAAACAAPDAPEAAAWAAADAAAAYAAAREAQARWIRENFALSDLHIN